MKKLVFSAVLILMSMFTLSAFAQADPCNEGRARGAAHANPDFQSCFTAWQGPGIWEVDVYVTATPGKDGYTYVVEAWACPACHGPNPCPKIACRNIATVYLDANFNVWYVSTSCM